jgi:NAD(P)-dependent dehydrogenase (short-subunit alcohol dehydrogenase family)
VDEPQNAALGTSAGPADDEVWATMAQSDPLFHIAGKRIALTGGAGVLGREMALALADRGARICLIDYDVFRAHEICKEIDARGGIAIPVQANVLDRAQLADAFGCAVQTLGGIDVLINGAGGNKKEATTSPELSFFDLPPDALKWVVDLNLLGTILPCQVFGQAFATLKCGVIVNIASMNAYRPLTKIPAYSAAKAAVSNFTQWLACHMALNYGPQIRVNAIAPGFFLTNQNRFLLMDDAGHPTPRGEQVLAHTPMGRYGDPSELIGTLVWLISDASRFVTGVVVPVDGGFNAYSGV